MKENDKKKAISDADVQKALDYLNNLEQQARSLDLHRFAGASEDPQIGRASCRERV